MPVYLAKDDFLLFELVRVVQTELSVKEHLTFIREITTMLLYNLSPNIQVTLGLIYFWLLGIILIHSLDLLLLVCLLHGGVHNERNFRVWLLMMSEEGGGVIRTPGSWVS